jgi:hypothetical protein
MNTKTIKKRKGKFLKNNKMRRNCGRHKTETIPQAQ